MWKYVQQLRRDREVTDHGDDGRVMRLALERFDEDRRARSEEQERRRERCLPGSPACGRLKENCARP
jgi:hypothetical protein